MLLIVFDTVLMVLDDGDHSLCPDLWILVVDGLCQLVFVLEIALKVHIQAPAVISLISRLRPHASTDDRVWCPKIYEERLASIGRIHCVGINRCSWKLPKSEHLDDHASVQVPATDTNYPPDSISACVSGCSHREPEVPIDTSWFHGWFASPLPVLQPLRRPFA